MAAFGNWVAGFAEGCRAVEHIQMSFAVDNKVVEGCKAVDR